MRRVGMYILLSAIALAFIGPFLILLSAGLKPPGRAVFSFPPDSIPRLPVPTWVAEDWTAIPFPRYLLNSVIYVGVMVPLYVLVSALCAYPLAHLDFLDKNLVFFAIVSTMFLPGEVMLIPRSLVVSQLGMADSFAGVILPGLLSAFGIFLLRQTFAGVPREVVDAARTDGCHELRILWHVMLPAARPTLAILAVFGFISVWNSFIWPLVVLKDSSKSRSRSGSPTSPGSLAQMSARSPPGRSSRSSRSWSSSCSCNVTSSKACAARSRADAVPLTPEVVE